MAIQSVGYGGEIDEVAWAQTGPMMGGRRYGVRGETDWRATIGTADRSVVVGTGTGFGWNIRDINTEPVTVTLAAVSSGVRWDLICAKRNWSTNATTFTVIPGTNVQDLPARATTPGEEDDQPLYLAKVEAGKSQVSELIDLRVWGGDGGATARHVLALQYLTQLGTAVLIEGVVWRRTVNGDGNAVWLRTPVQPQGGQLEGLTSGAIAAANANTALLAFTVPEAVQAGALLHIRADVEIFIPPGGSFAGYSRLYRGDSTILAQRRWHSQNRTGRFTYPSVELNLPVTQDIPAGTVFRFVLNSDPLSSGGVEVWHAFLSWGVS